MKHYIVSLKPASKSQPVNKRQAIEGIVKDTFNEMQKNIKIENENAEKIKLEIISKVDKKEIEDITIHPNAPFMYLKCTEKAVKEILKIKGVENINEDERHTPRVKKIRTKVPFFEFLRKKR